MGVPYLYLNLYKKYRRIKNIVVKNSDIPRNKGNRKLYFDFNSLIHPCANFVCNSDIEGDIENQIINFVIAFTKNIIQELTIDYSDVMIFVDGLAPFGKILQQKERRYKSIFLKLQNNEIGNFDSTQISPGTLFMKKLETALYNDNDIKNCCIDFSKGEAEHKIFKDIQSTNSNNNEILIYGLDADLIILSLLTDYNISLIRQKNIIPVDTDLSTEFEILNTTILKKAIIQEYQIKNVDVFFDNFVFISFLLGNDFIQKLPFINIHDLSDIIYICSKINNPIISLKEQNVKVDKTLFENILKEIYKMSKLSCEKRTKILNPLEYNNYNWLKNSSPEWIWVYKNNFIKYPSKFYKEKYYMYHGIKECDIKSLCNKYFNNLIWNFYYYKFNTESHFYSFHDLNCSPIIQDFIYNLFDLNIDIVDYKPKISTEKEQLKYILPNKELLKERKNPNIILDGYDCEWIWETKLI